MQNKKSMIIMGLLVLLVGAAAFIGGRMLNQRAGPTGLGLPRGNGDMMSVSIQITPASELPTTRPETLGSFVERKDNSIILTALKFLKACVDVPANWLCLESRFLAVDRRQCLLQEPHCH